MNAIKTGNKAVYPIIFPSDYSGFKYKAVEKGIEMVMIKPNFTSQRCSKCGCINKNNRTSQEKFKCTVCNYEVNADINAARNIATKDIEKIIEQQLNVQEKAIKHQLQYIE